MHISLCLQGFVSVCETTAVFVDKEGKCLPSCFFPQPGVHAGRKDLHMKAKKIAGAKPLTQRQIKRATRALDLVDAHVEERGGNYGGAYNKIVQVLELHALGLSPKRLAKFLARVENVEAHYGG
jgi:hypothetical protein